MPLMFLFRSKRVIYLFTPCSQKKQYLVISGYTDLHLEADAAHPLIISALFVSR